MNIIDIIIRDVCETDRADPCLRNTVCIDVEDLRVIIANNLAPTQGADARPVAISNKTLVKLFELATDLTSAQQFCTEARSILAATRDAASIDSFVDSRMAGQCDSCINDKCTTGKNCVTLGWDAYSCGQCKDTGYLPDGNHCQWCGLLAL